MSRGMRVHEIFSNQSQPDSKKKNDVNSNKHNGLSSKKTFAPMPPAKKFGGYKPKILSGSDDPISASNNHSNNHSSKAPPPISPRPKPVLTKPKPFIIGDKNVPMVLSTVDDNDDNSSIDSDMNDLNIYDTVIENTDRNGNGLTTSNFDFRMFDDTYLAPSNSHNPIEKENVSSGNVFDEMYLAPNDSHKLIEKERNASVKTDFATENPAFSLASELQQRVNRSGPNVSTHAPYTKGIAPRPKEFAPQPKLIVPLPKEIPPRPKEIIPPPEEIVLRPKELTHASEPAQHAESVHISQSQQIGQAFRVEQDDEIKGEGVQSDNVHIPEPDYGEEEKTMEFAEEDPDDSVEIIIPPTKPAGRKLAPLSSRVYQGEDWSHFLSDDDDVEDTMTDINTSIAGKGKRQSITKLNQKHSMFTAPSYDNTTVSVKGKNKGNKVKSPPPSSVRSFSYADSKYGTKGKSSARHLELRNNAADNFHDDSYESFLYSRHGHTMPSRISVDSSKEIGQSYGGKSEEDRLWKKLTFRLKNKRNSKNGYNMNEM